MDVNEDARLFNIKLRHEIKCYTRSSVFNNEHMSYPNINV